ncbi:hypothetical protein PIB30_085403 [Stylosanthes scabra]|uniref:Uncharacterized protein n=1 Tax=Stylosanthes scabra TaxID=79078 RepID=A0ABU6ZRL1_9FABA|nr:hypothetical protein [Stylosanthes scabra]
MTEIIKEATEEEVGNPDKEEEFFIATVYGGNEENPEDLPEKCADPGPCFVTCKVGKIYLPNCLCDPGAYASLARNGPSPSAKGKDKAYGPLTRVSPRLAALRAQAAANLTPEALVAPAIPTPPTTRRTAWISVKYYSMNLADRGGPSNVALVDKDPIELSSDSQLELKPEDTIKNLVEVEKEPEEEPEEDPEEDPEEEPEEENQGEEQIDEIYFANFFELAPANSSNESCTGPPPANI